jgi:hypothetical protein
MMHRTFARADGLELLKMPDPTNTPSMPALVVIVAFPAMELKTC